MPTPARAPPRRCLSRMPTNLTTWHGRQRAATQVGPPAGRCRLQEAGSRSSWLADVAWQCRLPNPCASPPCRRMCMQRHATQPARAAPLPARLLCPALQGGALLPRKERHAGAMRGVCLHRPAPAERLPGGGSQLHLHTVSGHSVFALWLCLFWQRRTASDQHPEGPLTLPPACRAQRLPAPCALLPWLRHELPTTATCRTAGATSSCRSPARTAPCKPTGRWTTAAATRALCTMPTRKSACAPTSIWPATGTGERAAAAWCCRSRVASCAAAARRAAAACVRPCLPGTAGGRLTWHVGPLPPARSVHCAGEGAEPVMCVASGRSCKHVLKVRQRLLLWPCIRERHARQALPAAAAGPCTRHSRALPPARCRRRTGPRSWCSRAARWRRGRPPARAASPPFWTHIPTPTPAHPSRWPTRLSRTIWPNRPPAAAQVSLALAGCAPRPPLLAAHALPLGSAVG